MPANIVPAGGEGYGDQPNPSQYPLWDTIVESNDYPVCPMCGEPKPLHDVTKDKFVCARCHTVFFVYRHVSVVYRCKSCHHQPHMPDGN